MTGFKDFSDGAPLAASDIDEYLMQGVLVFDSASARDTALSGNNREGRVCYLKDTNETLVYNGSSWASVGVPTLTNSQVTSTTGSPGTAVYTESDVSYTAYRFTGSGSLVLSNAGMVGVLVTGGGGGGGGGYAGYSGGGGGAGGLLEVATAYLPAGTVTVTIGAGGPGGSIGGVTGQSSLVGSYVAPGGGGGATDNYSSPQNGGSGGGGVQVSGTGQGIATLGSAGYNAAGGGGGGAGSAGGASTGGSGKSSTYAAGTAVTYAAGARGGTNTKADGAANTGNGGTGVLNNSGTPGNGGSGVVVVRVRT